MDVVNGGIVSARVERASADQPRRGLAAGGVESGDDHRVLGEERGRKAWGERGSGVTSLGVEPGSARWNPATFVGAHSGAFTTPVLRPVADHGGGGGGDGYHQQRHGRFGSETNLDQMMATYESLVTQAVSGHIAKQRGTARTSSSDQKSLCPTWSAPMELLSDAASKQEMSEAQTLVRSSLDLKRKRALKFTSSEETDHLDCGWSHPLRILVRKGLSVSDVGDLGRIVIPKKDAESQFQHIDTKEGTLLEMDDYSRSRRWYFRFKWWSNNKSRMYVLENTREFIKYHNLKEHDIFVVYEDSSRKMVVRAHKGPALDSKDVEILQGTNVGSKPSSTEDQDGPASTAAIA